ncbi:hypothetical protein X350_06860 [Oenococcus oeni S12]|uniref:TIR domain-containing protein n=1 Tax=Oenococcus oeni TaxID=1247 RepID=UPI00050F2C09|nr:TIR domain-containing protein [Oenococcus oeni]KGH87803.1 hypothetical protein X350_06860 [Oenococcus oeni S12]
MGYKVFVSYKYADKDVFQNGNNGTVRDYVDYLQEHKFTGDDFNKAEDDHEDLSAFRDETIQSHLKDKIWDSSVTIILISKNMRDPLVSEQDQWIPWEISYSLRTQVRDKKRSNPNALLAIVLPDSANSYEYFLTKWQYVDDNNVTQYVRTIHTDTAFEIIRKNMFNQKNPEIKLIENKNVYFGACSYIPTVKWKDFLEATDKYLDEAVALSQKKEEYWIQKQVHINEIP